MKSDRQEKMEMELIKAASLFIQRESNRQTLITITGCNLSPDFKNATLLVTVLPIEKESSAIDFLKRHMHELRNFIKKNINMKSTPFFNVELDLGEKNRQKIDEISHKV